MWLIHLMTDTIFAIFHITDIHDLFCNHREQLSTQETMVLHGL